MRTVTQQLSGWGRYPQQRCQLVRPEKYRALQAHQLPCIARGQGRSYGDASLNENHTVILTERLNRLLAFDQIQGILTAEAGVTLKEILDVIVPAGWFLPVTPGTKYVSLGGCVATDVHGKNHHRAGTISNYINAFELITASGEKLHCTPQENTELFWATIGGMGLTGLIGTVTLKLQRLPSRVMRVKQQCYFTLAETLQALNQSELEDDYSVAWIDGLNKKTLGRSVVFTAHHATPEEIPANYHSRALHQKKLPMTLLRAFMHPLCLKVFNSLYFQRHRHQSAVNFMDYGPYFYPLDHMAHWNLLYGKHGFIQFQCVFPAENALHGNQQLLNIIQQHHGNIFLAVLKRFGAQGKGLLSFPQPGFTLALDMPFQGEKTLQLLEKCHELVATEGGRIYLAKDACLKTAHFQTMYPRYTEWLAIKQRIDPENIFQSSLSRRLGIIY